MSKAACTYYYIEKGLGILILIFSLLFFIFVYNYHLHFAEQMQLFLLSSSYLKEYFTKPAALSRLLGDFLTQFYYLRGGGAIVITTTLLLIWMMIRFLIHHFSGYKNASILALLPIVIVLSLHTNVLYTLSFTVAIFLSLAVLNLLILIKKPSLMILIGFLLVPILYFLVGSPFLLFAILLVGYVLQHSYKKGAINYLIGGFIMLVALLTPILFRDYFLLTHEQAWLFPANRLFDTHGWLPILGATIIGIILIGKYMHSHSTFMTIVEIAVILLVATFSMIKQTNFGLEKILAIDSEIYFNKIEKAQVISEKYQLKNTAGIYFHNLLSSKMNNLAEQLMNSPQTGPKSLFLPVDQQQSYITIAFANEVYYHLGDVNTSQHLSLLGTIFSPRSESSRLMRRLVQINIINGEYAVAEKFIKTLEKSLFHKKWASSMRKYLDNEDLCAMTPWISEKRAIRPVSEELKRINDNEKALQLLLQSNSNNKVALDYLNCWYLLNKDIESFADVCLSKSKNQLKDLPVLYQQALLIYYMKRQDQSIFHSVDFNREVVAMFNEYMDLYELHKGDGNELQRGFKDTYWFYYHFAKLTDN